jgi:hypothetical protein
MKIRCNFCRGAGWLLDHHKSCQEVDSKMCRETCPIQIQCEYCKGLGEHKVNPDDIEWDD